MGAFCISPNVCSISDLKFIPDSLPKGMLEILFVSRLNRDAKSFPSEFSQMYLVDCSFHITNLGALNDFALNKTITP